MTRRAMIEALLALPAVGGITTIPAAPPGVDRPPVIVVECTQALTLEAQVRLRDQLRDVFPGHRILVADHGIRIREVR